MSAIQPRSENAGNIPSCAFRVSSDVRVGRSPLALMIVEGLLTLGDIAFATIISVKLIGLTAVAAGAFEIAHAFWTKGLAWSLYAFQFGRRTDNSERSTRMATPSRRAFLALAQKAIIAGAVGGIAVCARKDAEAMPLAPDPRGHGDSSDLLTQVQWGRPRRRRWVCWWRRGRRICGWRWV